MPIVTTLYMSTTLSLHTAKQRNTSTLTEHTTYWKLDTYDNLTTAKKARVELTKRNHACNSNTSRARALKLLNRSDRGLLSYDGRTHAELERFVCNRRLKASNAARKNKARLMAVLEAADYEMVFGKFMELPAELRVS